MITVTHHNNAYTCASAIKGSNYIHLLDENGNMIAAFGGVSDFSAFSISGGGWTVASSEDDCYVVVIGAGGVPINSGVKLCDIK